MFIHIKDPISNIRISALCVLAHFSLGFYTQGIHMRMNKQLCFRLTVCHYRVLNSYHSALPR